nr:uncharacterized protein LOC112426759 [Macaca nemestrina]
MHSVQAPRKRTNGRSHTCKQDGSLESLRLNHQCSALFSFKDQILGVSISETWVKVLTNPQKSNCVDICGNVRFTESQDKELFDNGLEESVKEWFRTNSRKNNLIPTWRRTQELNQMGLWCLGRRKLKMPCMIRGTGNTECQPLTKLKWKPEARGARWI